MFVAGLDDFAVDVARIASGLPSPPVLIGHSMGAAIVERLLVSGPVRAAALLAPVPPAGLGPVAHRLAAYQPEYLVNLHRLDAPHLSGDVLAALRPLYFSDDVAPEVLIESMAHLTIESPRAILDLTLMLQHRRPRSAVRPFVLGVAGDRISHPGDARATASFPIDRIRLPFCSGTETIRLVVRRGSAVGEQKANMIRWLAVALRTCTVSFMGPSGVRHSVEVTAESVYAAAALGVSSAVNPRTSTSFQSGVH